MKLISGFGLSGPFKSEQEFKMKWIDQVRTRCYAGSTFFEIENEEKEPGFPDVMRHSFNRQCDFYEMKLSDSKGNFTMQKTQPIFYRLHPDLEINVMVWHSGENRLYQISSTEIYKAVLRKNTLTLKIGDFELEQQHYN